MGHFWDCQEKQNRGQAIHSFVVLYSLSDQQQYWPTDLDIVQLNESKPSR